MKKTSYMQLFAIHDKKAETYETPFALPNKAYAIRSFQEAINKNTPYGKYAEDFELCKIGEYDQETGTLYTGVKPEVIIQASDLKTETTEDKNNKA